MTITIMDLASAIKNMPTSNDDAAAAVVRRIFDEITDRLAEGKRVELRGFCVLQAVDRPARMGRNLRTGEAIEIPARKHPHFKPGKALRDALNPPAAEPARMTGGRR